MQRDFVASLLLARLRSAALVLAVALALPGALGAQLAPPTTGGVTALDRILQRLSEPRRVLMVAAHPDDEDTSLLSLMSLWYGADAAYLSLSRGEGGQNLIGSELGEALGLVRSRELLAAREVDGTRQFFTRGFDFGYTRSVDEASIHWPPDSVLKDAVRVVRRFRPHVMVSVFSGTDRDGHGQHQLAGVTALAAFDAAGDSAVFPELAMQEGLTPWTPLKLYRSTRFSRAAETTLEMETGLIDPREGRSIYQISMASRSKHRSQDMGRLQPLGPRQSRLRLLTNRTVAADSDETDIFDGVPRASTPLTRLADSLRGVLSTRNLTAVSNALGAALTDPQFEVSPDQESLLRTARAIAGGVVIDAFTDDGELVPGQTVAVTLEVFNGGAGAFDMTAARIEAPAGWVVETDSAVARVVDPGELATVVFAMSVSPDAKLTQPYFLERPRIGSIYDWSVTPPEIRGLGFQPPPLHASVDGRIGDAPAGLRREVTYRFNNQAVGEMRQEIRVVPLVDVKLAPGQLVWPSGGDETYPFTVTLSYNGEGPYSGDVGVEIPGWTAPSTQRFSFSETGQSDSYVFEVAKPAGTVNVEISLVASAVGDDRRRFGAGIEMVDYPHIRPTPWARVAEATVRVALLVSPAVARVGYVRGAADRVPEALTQIGVPIELLDSDALAEADLSGFDVIVVGSRAYETDAALVRHNGRLLEYAEAGGLLIVQYQQYAFVRGEFAPYPLNIGRPHDRVTDETAPVRLLEPDHSLFGAPNRITAGDWDGWPQERGLYFAQTWDDAYRPLLETNDPGREPLRGGLLVAEYGAGMYVYTGLSFFRALPAGTPGAFKLFLNLMSLKQTHAP